MMTLLAGCGNTNNQESGKAEPNENVNVSSDAASQNRSQDTQTETQNLVEELYVSFGDSEYFTMHLNDSDTAQRIAYYVGTESWQLPIYHYFGDG